MELHLRAQFEDKVLEERRRKEEAEKLIAEFEAEEVVTLDMLFRTRNF